MSIYNTGNMQVKVGSASVTGTSTEFSTYVQAGYIFKLVNDSTWYEIAAVNSNTSLTLTSRYANTSYHTTRAENVASTNNAATVYSGTLTNYPVIQENYVMTASNVRFTDDGAGVLTGTPTGSGTIDYDTGAWALEFTATFAASVNIVASFPSGDTLSAMSYQVVTDYTTNYSYPEMGLNDTNFQYIYTRAIRELDSDLNNFTASRVTATSIYATQDIEVTATPYGLILQSDDGSRYRITVENSGTILSTGL